MAACFVFEPHEFEQTYLWDRVAVAAASDNQRGNDRQGQRNLHANRGALSQSGLQIHGAANFLDIGLHDIHAHAAAGNVGDFFRRGKSGKENQVEDFAVGHSLQPVRA